MGNLASRQGSLHQPWDGGAEQPGGLRKAPFLSTGTLLSASEASGSRSGTAQLGPLPLLLKILMKLLQKPSGRCHCSCPGVIPSRECCLWAPGNSVSISLPGGTPASLPTQLSSQKSGNGVAFKHFRIPSLPAKGKQVSRGFAARTDVNCLPPTQKFVCCLFYYIAGKMKDEVVKPHPERAGC